MSFLTPLYLAGFLAVSLPLLFHLIRRSPTGQFPFSSLMFLSPSPPRLTRRSRLDNLLLLLLRAAALILLGIAFARPFLRSFAQLDVSELAGRRVVLLVDTSGSMRRMGIWPQVLGKIDGVLDDLGPGDDVALYRFDSDVQALVALDDVTPPDPRQKISQIRGAIASVDLSWAGSNLGEALITVADEVDSSGDAQSETIRQIVLIGDLQEGSQIEPLRTYDWPDDVQLTVHAVAAGEVTNAGLHLAPVLEEVAERTGPQEIRVRVANDRLSTGDQFKLAWADQDGGESHDDSVSVYVPPGESRIVRVPRTSQQYHADQLVLTGDSHKFDNSLHLVPIQQEEVPLIYAGSDAENDPSELRYYLQRAFPETSGRKVRLIALEPEDLVLTNELADVRLIVVGQAIPEDRTETLRDFLVGGGTVFFVLKDAACGSSLARLAGWENLAAAEADAGDYAMLGEIAFSDPLFASFADPRFNDFTKIHFWKHRKVDVTDVPNLRVLARFDDGDPALFEQTHGKGRLLVLTAGWHPADSQLARSTKFVPLISGILEGSATHDVVPPQYEVSEAVALPARDAAMDVRVSMPDTVERIVAKGARSFDETDLPGVYQLALGDTQQRFAVNVPAAESKTAPMTTDQLSELGVRLGSGQTRAEMAEELRQMRDMELERQQKLWRWLIVAAVGILILETWLAGHLARSAGNAVKHFS
jgi:hypothetical protein